MAKKKSKVGSKLGFTSRQIGTMKSMASRGISRKDIAKKFGIATKTLSNLLYAAGWRRSEHATIKDYIKNPRERVSGYSAKSGRRDKLTYDVQRMTPTAFINLSENEKKGLTKQLQREIAHNISELKRNDVYDSSAQNQVDKNIEWFKKHYGDYNPYTVGYNKKFGSSQFEMLRRYLVEYKTGYLEGYKTERAATLNRLLSGIPESTGAHKVIANLSKEQEKKLWQFYRTNIENNKLFTDAYGYEKDQKQYVYGSDFIQQSISQFMFTGDYDEVPVLINTEEDLEYFLLTIAERAYNRSQELRHPLVKEELEDELYDVQLEFRRMVDSGRHITFKEFLGEYKLQNPDVVSRLSKRQ